jgi:hypothetical protein
MTLWDALNTSSDDRYVHYTVSTCMQPFKCLHAYMGLIHTLHRMLRSSTLKQTVVAACILQAHSFQLHALQVLVMGIMRTSVAVCERYSMQLLQHTLEQTGCRCASGSNSN